MESFKIFIVEDDPLYAEMMKYHLSLDPDYQIETFTTGMECLKNLYKKPDLITVDFSLPDISGKELLIKIHSHDKNTGVIIVSGQKDINTAVELLNKGAFDYIVKDEDTYSRLWNSVRLMRANLILREENEKLRVEVGRKYEFSNILIGLENGFPEIFRMMEKAASSDITVSITGETGTGKELVAKAIHYYSARKSKSFIPVNMGAIPKDLIESELFGYEKGAFTGAISRKSGLFEDAHNGTIFLDEIAELDMNMQTKLLRVLQEKEIKRIGGSQTIKVDVRVITATHKNLPDEVQKGNFRPDLFYRVMGLPINLPPLRERGNDIIILAKHFADLFCTENKRMKMEFTEEAIIKLMNYSYPGNVRELKATIELAIILSDDSIIDAKQINFISFRSGTDSISEELTLEEQVLKIVNDCLIKYRNPTIVAEKLGISRATVYRYIKTINQ